MFYQPHTAMDKQLLEDLFESDFLKKPMPIHEEETREERCAKKKTLKSQLLDSMETLDNWMMQTEDVRIEISKERCIDGETSLKMTCPCKLDHWNGVPGRLYAVPRIKGIFQKENWEEYNRLSLWIYPDLPGHRQVSFNILLENAEYEGCDELGRYNGHVMNLKNQQWNHILVEIPYMPRDQVIGLCFTYDMAGHEPCAGDIASWYIDRLELQKVEEDAYEGWETGKDRIAFCHSGYQPGMEKTAIASNLEETMFSIVDARTQEIVLTKSIDIVKTMTGQFQVMDFTEVVREGTYYIQVGDIKTRTFSSNERVWMGSIWKVLNFYFCQRCGYRVPGSDIAPFCRRMRYMPTIH